MTALLPLEKSLTVLYGTFARYAFTWLVGPMPRKRGLPESLLVARIRILPSRSVPTSYSSMLSEVIATPAVVNCARPLVR